MKFRIGVRVMPRREVLDIQGRAVQETLSRHGRELSECRIGKYVELELEASNKDEALNKAREISRFVLHNPLIETFAVEELTNP